MAVIIIAILKAISIGEVMTTDITLTDQILGGPITIGENTANGAGITIIITTIADITTNTPSPYCAKRFGGRSHRFIALSKGLSYAYPRIFSILCAVCSFA